MVPVCMEPTMSTWKPLNLSACRKYPRKLEKGTKRLAFIALLDCKSFKDIPIQLRFRSDAVNDGSTQWHNAQIHEGIITPNKRSAVGMVDVVERKRDVLSYRNMEGSNGTLEQSPGHQQ